MWKWTDEQKGMELRFTDVSDRTRDVFELRYREKSREVYHNMRGDKREFATAVVAEDGEEHNDSRNVENRAMILCRSLTVYVSPHDDELLKSEKNTLTMIRNRSLYGEVLANMDEIISLRNMRIRSVPPSNREISSAIIALKWSKALTASRQSYLLPHMQLLQICCLRIRYFSQRVEEGMSVKIQKKGGRFE